MLTNKQFEMRIFGAIHYKTTRKPGFFLSLQNLKDGVDYGKFKAGFIEKMPSQ